MSRKLDMKTIKTERLLITPTKEEDFKDLQKIADLLTKYADQGDCMPFYSIYEPKTTNDRQKAYKERLSAYFRKMVDEQLKGDKQLFYSWAVSVAATNEIIGFIRIEYIKDIETKTYNADLGYFINPEHFDKGYAFEAAHALLGYFFENNEDIQATFHPDNARSKNLLEKLRGKFVKVKETSRYGGEKRILYRISRLDFLHK